MEESKSEKAWRRHVRRLKPIHHRLVEPRAAMAAVREAVGDAYAVAFVESVEHSFYSYAPELNPVTWNAYALDCGGCFLAPAVQHPIRLHKWHVDETVSPLAAGLIVSCLAANKIQGMAANEGYVGEPLIWGLKRTPLQSRQTANLRRFCMRQREWTQICTVLS